MYDFHFWTSKHHLICSSLSPSITVTRSQGQTYLMLACGSSSFFQLTKLGRNHYTLPHLCTNEITFHVPFIKMLQELIPSPRSEHNVGRNVKKSILTLKLRNANIVSWLKKLYFYSFFRCSTQYFPVRTIKFFELKKI